MRGLAELIVVAMACLAPWAFGAVEAWAELGLYGGVAALTVLGAASGWGRDRSRDWLSAPSLLLAGLAALALVQAIPLPRTLLKALAPPLAALRTDLLPAASERVSGDPGPPVPLPPPTLSQEPEATVDTAVRLAAAWLLFQGVLGLNGGPAAYRRFAVALVGNATALALFSLVQWLSWNGKIYWLRPSPSPSSGPFVCHNHLAATLNLGLGLACGFLFAPGRDRFGSSDRGHRLWAGYAAGLIVVAIVASLSRSAFLALAGALVVTILLGRPRVRQVATGLAVLAVLVPLFLFALGSTKPYQQRLGTLVESGPYAERLQIWRDALRACPVYPVWGLGLGTFATTSARFFQSDRGEQYVHAENEYVEWLVEGGALGLGLYLAFLATTARAGWRACAAARSAEDRTLVLGGLFSGLTLVIHSFGDFALHIPGVAVAAVALAAHLTRLGSAARPVAAPGRPSRPRVIASSVLGLALAVLALALLAHGLQRARWERAIVGHGIPRLGTGVPLDGPSAPDEGDELDRRCAALEDALRIRPDWADGHLQYGLALLDLYERDASAALAERVPNPAARAGLTDPNWLRDIPIDELLTHESIREDLVPAAREFLEARRCVPVLALPHAELANLDFLLERPDPARAYLGRALRLSGANRPLLALITRSAVQRGALDLAARGWRQSLLIDRAAWGPVADAAGVILTPEQVLRDVVPDGRLTIQFADRLYAGPDDRAAYARFLREAIARLPHDRALGPAERLALEARAWARLDDREQATDRMKAALALEPHRADWRKDLVTWLIAREQLREAYEQAVLGLHYRPNHPDALQTLDAAAEALARGADPPASSSRPRGPAPP